MALLGKCCSAMVKCWCILRVHWLGLNAQLSRAHLDLAVMCFNPSPNLATDTINALSICCTKINFEAAVDVQVLCTASDKVYLEVWCRHCLLRLLHL